MTSTNGVTLISLIKDLERDLDFENKKAIYIIVKKLCVKFSNFCVYFLESLENLL